MAIDPTGRFVYAANRTPHNVSAYAINPRTGPLTGVPGPPFSIGASPPNSLTVDRTGRLASRLFNFAAFALGRVLCALSRCFVVSEGSR
ncbi:Lactonase, 7-bladed beta-propeller [Variovorax sp. OK605]|nr:Lactonase, 7-bladed beta-propeller [Variovorax sp. OK605]